MGKRFFKHYGNANTSESLSMLLEDLGLEGYGRYWLLLEYLTDNWDGDEACKFRVHRQHLRTALRVHSWVKLDSFLTRVGLVRGITKIECGSVYEIEAPILWELLGRDFKKARKDRASSAPKSKSKSKSKDNIPKFNFDKLYQKYPRKEGKQKGFAICLGKIKNQKDYDRLSQAIDNYAAQVKNEDKKFIKHFSSFMNCWEDYVLVEKPKQTKELWVGGKDGPVYK